LDRGQQQAWCNAGITAAKLGQHTIASEYLSEAVRLDPSDMIAQAGMVSVVKEKAEAKRRREFEVDDAAWNASSVVASRETSLLSALPTKKVATRHQNTLSLRQFYEEFAVPGIPVIIKGGVASDTLHSWSFDFVRQVCGDAPATVRTPKAGVWAGLASDPLSQMTVANYLDLINVSSVVQHSSHQPQAPVSHTRNGTNGGTHSVPYLFDFNLQQYCPAVLADWKYVSSVLRA